MSSFPWPAHTRRTPVLPVFLPFAGCPSRCVYCAQDLQTASELLSIETALSPAPDMLRQRAEQGLPPAELAFYGGTFTAQDEATFARCLAAVRTWMQEGLLTGWRCSTRPDALDSDRLGRMRDAGCQCVELGVQSFSDAVLAASRRGYDGETARRGTELVKSFGFICGVQLLPGLPGSTTEGFLADVEQSLQLGCDLLRFYPCLVVRGTVLARWYAQGRFVPWDEATTIETLARGFASASLHGVPVTRLGVAEEKTFEENVVAGPRIPDLGTKVRSLALYHTLCQHVPQGRRVRRAVLPRNAQGYLYGHGGAMRKRLAELGLTPANLSWHDAGCVMLELAEHS